MGKYDELFKLGKAGYGALSDAIGGRARSRLRNLDNTIEVNPPQSLDMYGKPSGSDPRFLGAAPDRTDLTFLRYKPKKTSDRMTTSLESMRNPDNPARIALMKDIARGEELGGNDWYNTEELRDWFVKELGQKQGDAEWREVMYLMGTTSPGSNVMANIGNMSAVRKRLISRGSNEKEADEYINKLMEVKKLQDAFPLAKTREKGYGHKTGGLQELNTAKYIQGEYGGLPEPDVALAKSSLVKNPKPKGFINSLLGGKTNIAADLHFTRYMAMASKHPDWLNTSDDVGVEFMQNVLKTFPDSKEYFKVRTFEGKDGVTQQIPSFNFKKAAKDGAIDLNVPISKSGETISDYPKAWASMPNDNEYGAFEGFIKEIADELGQTPAQVQANMWMGAADRTGVAESSQGTFMELIKTRAKSRAAKENKTPNEILQNFIRDGGLLSVAPIAATGGALALLPEDGRPQ